MNFIYISSRSKAGAQPEINNQSISSQILVFEESQGKPECPEKNLSVNSRESTNSTYT